MPSDPRAAGRWKRTRLLRRRRPVLGPPVPDIECGHRGWRSWMHCDLPFGHDGQHGTVIGRSIKTGGFVASSSVTREMWT